MSTLFRTRESVSEIEKQSAPAPRRNAVFGKESGKHGFSRTGEEELANRKSDHVANALNTANPAGRAPTTAVGQTAKLERRP